MAINSQPRIHAQPDDLVPRFMVRAMFGLVLAILAIVSIASFADHKAQSTPPEGQLINERAIHLFGQMSGAARVMDANGTLIADLDAEQGGFVAGVYRVIERERSKIDADMSAPVLLQLREGNRLSITDPVTGWSAELMGFGATNSRVFARLLD